MLQTVYTQICERDLGMALTTLPTIIKFLAPGQQLVVIDDGSVSLESASQISALSPSVKVMLKQERDEYVLNELRNYPVCLKYRADHPLAFKLLDIPLIAKRDSPRFTYTDSDIIYLKSCEDYFVRDVNTFLKTDAVKLSFQLKVGLLKYRWKIPYKFNSGYFSFDTKNYDLDFIEYFLAVPEVRNPLWLTEQTCWSFLFERAGASFCPAENQFICNEAFKGPNAESLAIHLIGIHDKPAFAKKWSTAEHINNVKESTPIFKRSRNVTLLDWIIKSVQRYSPIK